MGYYVGIQGVQQGPYELNELPVKGLRADWMVWTRGMSKWQRADTVPEIAVLIAPPAPLAQEPDGPLRVEALDPSSIQALQYQTGVPAAKSSGMAIASLVFGIIAFPLMLAYGLGLLASILAIIFGFIARADMKRHGTGGRGFALTGIILGIVLVGLAVVYLIGFLIWAATYHGPL